MTCPALSIACGLIALIVSGCARGGPGPDDGKPDLSAAREVLDRQVIAWNARDLDGFLVGYWNSPSVVFQSGGDRSDGWASMRDRYRKNYQAEGKSMGTLAFEGVEIEGLGPDVALARGRWTLTKDDGSKPTGLFTLILKRLPEGWRIVHDHTSIATPAKPSP